MPLSSKIILDQSRSIALLVDAGFPKDRVVDAIIEGDLTKLHDDGTD